MYRNKYVEMKPFGDEVMHFASMRFGILPDWWISNSLLCESCKWFAPLIITWVKSGMFQSVVFFQHLPTVLDTDEYYTLIDAKTIVLGFPKHSSKPDWIKPDMTPCL